MKVENYEVNELIITAKNKPGLLYKISKALSEKGINIDNIFGYVANGNAIIKVLTSDINSSIKELKHIDDIKDIKNQKVLIIKLKDRPGELAKITEKLNKRGVDLYSIYILLKEGGITHVALIPANKSIEELKFILED